MALTNSRPFQLPTSSDDNEILLNNTSPVFQASALGFNSHMDPLTATAADVFPVPTQDNGINSGSSQKGKASSNNSAKDGKIKKEPKEKDSLSIVFSKIIPVTDERPMPTDRSSPLDDEVLHRVFIILWEKDPDQKGMTVKQLCDHLLEKNPEMSNLSTKLSNLISAKLNAYVKKIEKGEKTLTYALFRDWSDSSPRRMLYVYKGILRSDYKEHAQAALAKIRQQQQLEEKLNPKDDDKKLASRKDSKKNSKAENKKVMKNDDKILGSLSSVNGEINSNQFLVDQNNVSFGQKISMANNINFTLSNDFNIPYSTSPVSANLTPRGPARLNSPMVSPSSTVTSNQSPKKNSVYNKKRPSVSDDLEKGGKGDNKKQKVVNSKLNNEQSVSNSNSNGISTMNGSPVPYITAAAAAPKLSKYSTKDGFKSNSASSIGFLSAIQKVITTQTPIEPSSDSSRQSSNCSTGPSTPGGGTNNSVAISSWVQKVRSGFLIQDIESPETLSLEDLDSFFK
ncbi:hypothetical protein TPHA_0H02910 [Tetrapisispora phaffii CBS 4417]|uniref:GDS1 winged helix domain-containing protein n=1 Tax=Tetrapisispora phaffii (strain ATCC 24235 / CBS 4417 / NBRC 1672 / NRRL Y-8282 / UCD 70-5) TaxID=1071381 RepID=G8BWP3_TETPH|nr:hypothetical protein TPHA_0H02910 [Tetrapisispora phaffii CBS 4417]CCE64494.1 hypothetical protein TPHA_0H02910 [Tetrapisispora phaffii CBS 4417]